MGFSTLLGSIPVEDRRDGFGDFVIEVSPSYANVKKELLSKLTGITGLTTFAGVPIVVSSDVAEMRVTRKVK